MNPKPRKPLSRKRVTIVFVIIGFAFFFLLIRGITGATVYFRTADQAVAQKASLGTKRFRIEGTVAAGTVKKVPTGVAFDVQGEKVSVPVIHTGDEPSLFREGIPVVLEGHFTGGTFMSSQILIKHSESYKQANPDRVKDYPK